MSGVRSLVSARAGERVRILRILFDQLRLRCAAAGVGEGTVLRGQARRGGAVVAQTPKGEVVACEDRLARFIEVAAEDEEPGR